MALVGPPTMLNAKPLSVMFEDLRDERQATVPFPPGETRFSITRTRRFAVDPLPILLDSYQRYGPIFTLRLFHSNVVFMLGPAANHYVTVSHASNFQWRESHFRDLIGLMGDGLLTIDGDFHRRSRLIMLPAFHREHIAASAEAILLETESALDRLRAGTQVDLYAWTRHLALRVAMRALFGLDPDGPQARAIDAAGLFEEALSFYSSEYVLRVMRGRHSPWGKMQSAARKLDRLIYSEISERRTSGARGSDILSLLLDASDEDGNRLSDLQIRDEVMTLMFAGHDTTTSTVSFMFYELARHPDIVARLIAEQDLLLTDGRPTASQLMSGELTELELVLDETLRKYPPPGSARVAPSSRSSSKARRCPPAPSSTTAPGPPTTCPTSSPTPRPSVPSASRPRPRRRCPRAPTFPSAGARGPASECALASSRCVPSPR